MNVKQCEERNQMIIRAGRKLVTGERVYLSLQSIEILASLYNVDVPKTVRKYLEYVDMRESYWFSGNRTERKEKTIAKFLDNLIKAIEKSEVN